ncbi:MAG: phosphoribosylglycinamide formyltransferase [Candidatus Omnitrophica bacterium]|nr:phosphoribosylglycinamide formyltransferase [Candidatus Omnitrophota bacterium]
MNIAVFASGNGTNLQALIDAEAGGGLSPGKIVLVVSDKAGAFALERAKKAGIETRVIEANGMPREEYDKKVMSEIKDKNVDLIVLAGFMRILSSNFVKQYNERILNIHPALLPAFKGTHGIKDAFEAGVEVTGVTVHFVNEELDAGPIILQEEVPIEKGDTLETLEEKIHAVEHRLYPKAVKLFAEGKLKIEGEKVRIRS